MALKLVWDNPNVVATNIAIYRGDAPLDFSTGTPTPLTVLSNGEKSWIDDTAQVGRTYYYVLGARTANDEVRSGNQKILVADNRGVGPSVLQYGDDNLGYFGSVLNADFVNYTHIAAAAATPITATTWNPTWHKFIRNGKIIYVPDSYIPFFTTWQLIYQAGFVFGIDAVAPPGHSVTGLTPTNQLRVIEFKGQRYKIRLMRGWDDAPIADFNPAKITSTEHDIIVGAKNNEYNDFLYGLNYFVPLLQRSENFASYDPSNWLMPSYSGNYINDNAIRESNRGRLMMQERVNGAGAASANVLTRGVRPTGYATGPAYTKAYLSYISMMPGNGELLWVPVLELIEDVIVTV